MEELPGSLLQVDNSQILTFWEQLDEESKSSCLKLECQTIIEHVLEKVENTEFFQIEQVNRLYKSEMRDSWSEITKLWQIVWLLSRLLNLQIS